MLFHQGAKSIERREKKKERKKKHNNRLASKYGFRNFFVNVYDDSPKKFRNFFFLVIYLF